MIEKSKQKYPWINKIILLSGVFSISVLGFSSPAIAAEKSATANISVTATVPLSDYFADLIATHSTVVIETESIDHYEVNIQIRSDRLTFGNHPLKIHFRSVATGENVLVLTSQTVRGGYSSFLIDKTSLAGLYRLQVIDLAYDRPIILVTEPRIFFGTESSHQELVFSSTRLLSDSVKNLTQEKFRLIEQSNNFLPANPGSLYEVISLSLPNQVGRDP